MDVFLTTVGTPAITLEIYNGDNKNGDIGCTTGKIFIMSLSQVEKANIMIVNYIYEL